MSLELNNNFFHNKDKVFIFILFFVVAITLVVSLYFDSALVVEPLASKNLITFNKGWTLQVDGTVVEKNLTLPYFFKGEKVGKEITVSRLLPTSYSHSHICFSTTTKMSSFKLLIDDESIYSFSGDTSPWKKPVLGGRLPHFIYLPDDSMGKKITLVYDFSSNSNLSGNIDAPIIGTKTDLILYKLKEWPALLFGFIFLLLGFLVMVSSYLFAKKMETASLRYYGLLEIILGLWVFTQTPSRFILFRNPAMPITFSILALFLLPYGLIQYVKTSYTILDKKTEPFFKVSLLFLVAFVIGGISQLLGLFQYVDMLAISGLALVVYIITLTIVLGIDYRRGNRDLITFLLAISVLGITVLAEETLLILDITVDSAIILHTGMSISGVIFLVRTASVIASEKSLSVKEKMLLDLVFTDSLTGVHNRRSFDDFIDKVIHNENDIQILGIVVCDINGLKKINDKYGHSSGDSILMGFCRGLKGIIPDSSTIYRIGGDEFVVIIPHITQEQLDVLSLKIFEILESSPIKEYGVAVGTRLFIDQKTQDILTLIKEADKAMYECKARMKEKIANSFKTNLNNEQIS